MMTQDTDIDTILIRNVVSISFDIRAYIYDTIKNIHIHTGCKGFIDVGSGRYQSSQIMNNTGLGYVACDPYLNVSLAKKRSIDITNMSATSIVSALDKVFTRKDFYCHYIGRIEDLIATDGVFNLIKRRRVPIAYSFSLSHVYKMFNKLSMFGVKQIGCCYTYDSIDKNGVLVDIGGISMKQTNNEVAISTVKFGYDDAYEENIVTKKDIEYDLCIQCSDIINDFNSYSTPTRYVCKNIHVFNSNV